MSLTARQREGSHHRVANNLSPTVGEKNVLVLLAHELSRRQVAAEMGISKHTVDSRINMLFEKSGTNTTEALIAHSWRVGWLPSA